jgi:hypothetical protein
VQLVEHEPWRIEHKIPLALLVGLVVQTIYFTIWLRDLAAEVKSGNSRMEEVWRDRYTRADALKDRELIDSRIESLQWRVGELERRVGEHDRADRYTNGGKR